MRDESAAEPMQEQLRGLAEQISAVRLQLDEFMTRRNESVADRASRHVASIIAAAERSATEIRTVAEKDAERIRTEARAETGSGRERATRPVTEASAGAAPSTGKNIADELASAVGDLQTAAEALERSLQSRAIGAQDQRVR